MRELETKSLVGIRFLAYNDFVLDKFVALTGAQSVDVA
jgi:hypothetical protein